MSRYDDLNCKDFSRWFLLILALTLHKLIGIAFFGGHKNASSNGKGRVMVFLCNCFFFVNLFFYVIEVEILLFSCWWGFSSLFFIHKLNTLNTYTTTKENYHIHIYNDSCITGTKTIFDIYFRLVTDWPRFIVFVCLLSLIFWCTILRIYFYLFFK